MSSYFIQINDFIEDLKAESGSNDISGIVIFGVKNFNGSTWDIIDSNQDEVYEEFDISNATYTNAYFLPYNQANLLSIGLNSNVPNSGDYIDFYLIPSASMANFTSPTVNINNVASSINTNVIYRIFEDYMSAIDKENAWKLIDPIILTPPATVQTNTTATLPILSSYTPAQVNSLFDTRDTGLRVVETKSEQTIAAEVKNYLGVNGRLPQFKNYGDYLAYKNAINLQNGLLQRYG
jgi:hypothetical protein